MWPRPLWFCTWNGHPPLSLFTTWGSIFLTSSTEDHGRHFVQHESNCVSLSEAVRTNTCLPRTGSRPLGQVSVPFCSHVPAPSSLGGGGESSLLVSLEMPCPFRGATSSILKALPSWRPVRFISVGFERLLLRRRVQRGCAHLRGSAQHKALTFTPLADTPWATAVLGAGGCTK